MYGTYEDANYFYIVTELCNGGDLFQNLAQRDVFLEQDAAYIGEGHASISPCFRHQEFSSGVSQICSWKPSQSEASSWLESAEVACRNLAKARQSRCVNGHTLIDQKGVAFFKALMTAGVLTSRFSCGLFVESSIYDPSLSYPPMSEHIIHTSALSCALQSSSCCWPSSTVMLTRSCTETW
jgi:hypothetical protein